MEIDPAARRHGIAASDMVHAVQHHWRAFETDDPAVLVFVGPSRSGEPLEVGVVDDDNGLAIIHAMPARQKFLKGWWKP